jgi:outer membrane protein insertion porin family
MLVGNIELMFPPPGFKEKNVRLSAFVDFGNVWGEGEKITGNSIRVSTGVAVSWDSPVGPLKFALGFPIRKQPQDKIERFQFQLGKIF